MELPDIDALSFDEKRRLVEKLLESMAAENAARPVPEWHLELVRESLAEYERTGDRGEPARQAIERIFRNL